MSPSPFTSRPLPSYIIPTDLLASLPLDAVGCLITSKVTLSSRESCINLPFQSKSADRLLPCTFNKGDRSYWLNGEPSTSEEALVRLLVVLKHNALDMNRLPGKPHYECIAVRPELDLAPSIVRREQFRFMLEHVAGTVDIPIKIENSTAERDYYALADFYTVHQDRFPHLLALARSLRKPPRYQESIDSNSNTSTYSPRALEPDDEFK